MRFKNTNRSRKAFTIIGGIDPEALKIRFCKAYRFHSHKGHIAGKRKIPSDKPSKPLQRMVIQARNDKPEFNLQAASRKIENALYGFVECAVCLHNEIVLMRYVRVQRNADNKIWVANVSDILRKCQELQKTTVAEEVQRRVGQKILHPPYQLNQSPTEQCRLTSGKSNLLGVYIH